VKLYLILALDSDDRISHVVAAWLKRHPAMRHVDELNESETHNYIIQELNVREDLDRKRGDYGDKRCKK